MLILHGSTQAAGIDLQVTVVWPMEAGLGQVAPLQPALWLGRVWLGRVGLGFRL